MRTAIFSSKERESIKTYLKHGKYPDKNFKVVVHRSKKHYDQILYDLGLLCCLLEKSTNKQTKRTADSITKRI